MSDSDSGVYEEKSVSNGVIGPHFDGAPEFGSAKAMSSSDAEDLSESASLPLRAASESAVPAAVSDLPSKSDPPVDIGAREEALPASRDDALSILQTVIESEVSESTLAAKSTAEPISPVGAPLEAVDTRDFLSGETSSDETPRRISGMLDGVIGGVASGWAVDEAAPEERLQIEIWEDGVCIASGSASNLREDLRWAKIGDGQCAFAIGLASGLTAGKEDSVAARVGGSNHVLARAPTCKIAVGHAHPAPIVEDAHSAPILEPEEASKTPTPKMESEADRGTQAGAPIPSATMPPRASTSPSRKPAQAPLIRGQVDAVVEGCARGWALDETAPQKRLQVEILADGNRSHSPPPPLHGFEVVRALGFAVAA